jgi:hypothetical protein
MKKGRKQSAVFLKDLAERYREIAVGNGFDIK